MRYSIIATKQYEKSLRRFVKSGNFDIEELNLVINLLISDSRLDPKYKDHKLTGNLKDFRECHIEPDILLIYQKIDAELILVLVNIGSHSNLFK